MVLNQLFDPPGIGLCVAAAGKGVFATRAFDKDGRPDEASLDVDGSDLADAYTDLVITEPRPLATGDRFIVDLDHCRKEEVPPGQTACSKYFGWHLNSP